MEDDSQNFMETQCVCERERDGGIFRVFPTFFLPLMKLHVTRSKVGEVMRTRPKI